MKKKRPVKFLALLCMTAFLLSSFSGCSKSEDEDGGKKKKTEECEILDCENDAYKYGVCKEHYKEFKEIAEKEGAGEGEQTGETCKVQDCDREVFSKGLCLEHYVELMKAAYGVKTKPPKGSNGNEDEPGSVPGGTGDNQGNSQGGVGDNPGGTDDNPGGTSGGNGDNPGGTGDDSGNNSGGDGGLSGGTEIFPTESLEPTPIEGWYLTPTPEPTPTPTLAPTPTPTPTPAPTPAASIFPEPKNPYYWGNGKAVPIEQAKKGDLVFFGRYEQDNDPGNGPEDIAWGVLDRQGDKVLLLAYYGLDVKKFHDEKKDQSSDPKDKKTIPWAKCKLREWMNGFFYNQAFNSLEKSHIIASTIENNYVDSGFSDGVVPNSTKIMAYRKSTTDSVFLLSVDEILKYMPVISSSQGQTPMGTRFVSTGDATDIRAKLTAYCAQLINDQIEESNKHKLIKYDKRFKAGELCNWWLRTSDWGQQGWSENAWVVYSRKEGDGMLGGSAIITQDAIAVRPAIWVSVNELPTDGQMREKDKNPGGSEGGNGSGSGSGSEGGSGSGGTGSGNASGGENGSGSGTGSGGNGSGGSGNAKVCRLGEPAVTELGGGRAQVCVNSCGRCCSRGGTSLVYFQYEVRNVGDNIIEFSGTLFSVDSNGRRVEQYVRTERVVDGTLEPGDVLTGTFYIEETDYGGGACEVSCGDAVWQLEEPIGAGNAGEASCGVPSELNWDLERIPYEEATGSYISGKNAFSSVRLYSEAEDAGEEAGYLEIYRSEDAIKAPLREVEPNVYQVITEDGTEAYLGMYFYENAVIYEYYVGGSFRDYFRKIER